LKRIRKLLGTWHVMSHDQYTAFYWSRKRGSLWFLWFNSERSTINMVTSEEIFCLLHMVFTSRNWFVMQGPVAIILISWNVIFIWETGYWTRAIKRFALFYDFKIEVVPFIINFSTDLTTVVKFEIQVQKWCGRSGICGLYNFQLWRIYQWKTFCKSRIL
jgi:hypothetical protein